MINSDDLVRQLRVFWNILFEDGLEDLKIDIFGLLGAVLLPLDPFAHCKQGRYFDKIIDLIIDKIVFDHDGPISNSKLFLLAYFLQDFLFLAEFVDLGLLERFPIKRLDVLDLR